MSLVDLIDHVRIAKAIAHEHWVSLPDNIKAEIYDSNKTDTRKFKQMRHIVAGRYGLVYVEDTNTLLITIERDV